MGGGLATRHDAWIDPGIDLHSWGSSGEINIHGKSLWEVHSCIIIIIIQSCIVGTHTHTKYNQHLLTSPMGHSLQHSYLVHTMRISKCDHGNHTILNYKCCDRTLEIRSLVFRVRSCALSMQVHWQHKECVYVCVCVSAS